MKKYYIKLLTADDGYLNLNQSDNSIFLSDNEQVKGFKTQFTKSEIEDLKDKLTFKITNNMLEEI